MWTSFKYITIHNLCLTEHARIFKHALLKDTATSELSFDVLGNESGSSVVGHVGIQPRFSVPHAECTLSLQSGFVTQKGNGDSR